MAIAVDQLHYSDGFTFETLNCTYRCLLHFRDSFTFATVKTDSVQYGEVSTTPGLLSPPIIYAACFASRVAALGAVAAQLAVPLPLSSTAALLTVLHWIAI